MFKGGREGWLGFDEGELTGGGDVAGDVGEITAAILKQVCLRSAWRLRLEDKIVCFDSDKWVQYEQLLAQQACRYISQSEGWQKDSHLSFFKI